jgi:tellurite methyltransferase
VVEMDARERWNRRFRERPPLEEPASFLTDLVELLPLSGRALDVAGGGGRNALWLAARGLEVTLVDGSDEACAIARRRADEVSAAIDVRRVDLDVDGVPAGPWTSSCATTTWIAI